MGRERIVFTAARIPGIARRYPATLAGPRYPAAIPVVDEDDGWTAWTPR